MVVDLALESRKVDFEVDLQHRDSVRMASATANPRPDGVRLDTIRIVDCQAVEEHSSTGDLRMFELEAFPVPNDDFFPAAIAMAPSEVEDAVVPETPSAKAAAAKRAEAERKREERARRRADGVPDPRAVDAAVIGAIVAAAARRGHGRTISQTKSLAGLAISLQDIIGGAMQELVENRGIGQPQAKRALLIRLGLAR
ncbi:hypothetical protein [Methylobacterium sp. A52T]